jgi:purine-binding chemotaxis protein CheW
MDNLTGTAAAEIRLLRFRLGEALFAIDLMRISEVVASRALSPSTAASPFTAGSLVLRNSVIPVIDLAGRFGVPRDAVGGAGELIVVRLPGTLLALAVDQVLELMAVKPEGILPAGDGDGVGSDFALGICHAGADQVMILDIDLLHAATPLCRSGENGVNER